jgi:CHAD domain-containing protein
MTASKTRPPRNHAGEARPAGVDYSALLAGRAREFLRWVEVIATHPAPTPDDVHDARVAGRRLAAAIRFFEPLLRRRRARRLRRAVRAAIGALGDFRDADILVALLEGAGKPDRLDKMDAPDIARAQPTSSVSSLVPAAGDPPDDPLAAAIAALRAGRDGAAERSREDFMATLTPTALRRLRRMAERGLPSRYARAPWPELLPMFAALQLRRVTDDFLALAARVDRASPPEALHRLRIAGKRLRYSVEIALSPRAARTLLATLRDLQDMLGTLHDLDVAIEFVENLARGGQPTASVFDRPSPPGAAAANVRLAKVVARLRADRADLHRRFLRAWPRHRFEALTRRITAVATLSTKRPWCGA